MCEKYYIWNSVTCSCKNGKYLRSIIDGSVDICDKIIDATKAVTKKPFQQKVLWQSSVFYSSFY